MKLSRIARKAHISPKTARRRLRELRMPKPGTRWDFPQDQVRKVVRLIRD